MLKKAKKKWEKSTKKRTRRVYSQEFKYEVLSYYYSHGEQRRMTYEKYGKLYALHWSLYHSPTM